MATLDGWMSVAEAAEQLGISRGRVRELVAAGRLVATRPAGNLLIKCDAVKRRLHVEKPQSRQPWSPRMAWAVLAIVSGERPSWLSSSELVRARRYARRPLGEWPWMLSKRAEVHRVRVPAAITRRLVGLPGISIGGTM
jgi:excisionase family DNA binding protein